MTILQAAVSVDEVFSLEMSCANRLQYQHLGACSTKVQTKYHTADYEAGLAQSVSIYYRHIVGCTSQC